MVEINVIPDKFISTVPSAALHITSLHFPSKTVSQHDAVWTRALPVLMSFRAWSGSFRFTKGHHCLGLLTLAHLMQLWMAL